MLLSRKVLICAKVHSFSSIIDLILEGINTIQWYIVVFLPFAEATPKHTALLCCQDLKCVLSCQNKSKQHTATNFHVTFRFLNFRMTFSSNFSGLGSIVTAIILELIYLWRNCIWKWTRTKEAILHIFCRFRPIFHEGGMVRDKQGVFQP